MHSISESFITYVRHVTAQPVTWKPLAVNGLPTHLREAYQLAEIAIGELPFLAIVAREGQAIRPAAFQKHAERLQRSIGKEAPEHFCLVAEDIPAYTRQRLIERRIPFVVPGRELFLPQLGQAARKRQARKAPKPVEKFSPATQMLVLLALNEPTFFPARAKDVAARLNVTGMTITRAFNEIEASQLGRVTRKANERWLEFSQSPEELWKAAQPYLRNPVVTTKRIHLSDLPPEHRIEAGETALTHYANLLPPPEPTFAIAQKDWKKLLGHAEEIPVAEPGTCKVELWRFDPQPMAGEARLDRVALWVSFMDVRDDRIRIALASI